MLQGVLWHVAVSCWNTANMVRDIRACTVVPTACAWNPRELCTCVYHQIKFTNTPGTVGTLALAMGSSGPEPAHHQCSTCLKPFPPLWLILTSNARSDPTIQGCCSALSVLSCPDTAFSFLHSENHIGPAQLHPEMTEITFHTPSMEEYLKLTRGKYPRYADIRQMDRSSCPHRKPMVLEVIAGDEKNTAPVLIRVGKDTTRKATFPAAAFCDNQVMVTTCKGQFMSLKEAMQGDYHSTVHCDTQDVETQIQSFEKRLGSLEDGDGYWWISPRDLNRPLNGWQPSQFPPYLGLRRSSVYTLKVSTTSFRWQHPPYLRLAHSSRSWLPRLTCV